MANNRQLPEADFYTIPQLAKEWRDWGWTEASIEHQIELGFLRQSVVRDRIRIFRRSGIDLRFFKKDYAKHDSEWDESEFSESRRITKNNLVWSKNASRRCGVALR